MREVTVKHLAHEVMTPRLITIQLHSVLITAMLYMYCNLHLVTIDKKV